MIMMIVAGMVFLALRGSRALNRGQQPQQLNAGPVRYGETPIGDAARTSLDTDITRFGDELRDLDLDVVGIELSEEAQTNYSEALDAYENAKQAMNQARYESDAIAIAHILEEGRYAMACVKSHAQGKPMPERRPPCFFDPAHGPSAKNVTWAPPGGAPREVPACALDAARVTSGSDPHIRMVQQGYQAVPYWQDQGHAAYARGYYEPYGLDPVVQGLAKGALMFGGFSLLMGLLDD
jgi:hypothetical protein